MNKLSTRVTKLANASQVSSVASTLDMSKLKSYDEIPGPKSYPIFGSIFSLKQFGGDLDLLKFDSFLFLLNERYGDLAKLDLFGQKQVVTFKPEHAKIIFHNEGQSPVRPTLDPWVLYAKRKNYSLSLINSQDEAWKKQRSASNPIVAKPKTVASYINIHNSITDEYFNILKKKSINSTQIIIDKFERQLKLLILERNSKGILTLNKIKQVMSVVAFDNRIECINENKTNEEALKLFEALPKYTETTAKLFYGAPLWKWIRTPSWIEFEKTSDYIYEFTRKYVMEAYEKLKNNKGLDQNGGTTMLEQFYLNREKSKLTVGDIVSMMSEFLLASFDTTSTTLHFLLTQLGTHLDIQEEIYNEIKAVYPQNGYIDTDFFSKIPLLKAALKESQRLNNIAPNTVRILNVDITLDNFLIPKGTLLNIGLINMCYSEKYYKNAKTFNPKRWLKSQQADPIDPYTSLPFGFGARQCIGRRLAEQKMYLILSKLIKQYKIEYIGENKPTQFRLLKLPGNDLKIKLTPRLD